MSIGGHTHTEIRRLLLSLISVSIQTGRQTEIDEETDVSATIQNYEKISIYMPEHENLLQLINLYSIRLLQTALLPAYCCLTDETDKLFGYQCKRQAKRGKQIKQQL
uniref:Uncharacterized protein n=1 Tax=Glossina austeni TaxID=7395 RepID=A0A1A9UXU9_GLOAU